MRTIAKLAVNRRGQRTRLTESVLVTKVIISDLFASSKCKAKSVLGWQRASQTLINSVDIVLMGRYC